MAFTSAVVPLRNAVRDPSPLDWSIFRLWYEEDVDLPPMLDQRVREGIVKLTDCRLFSIFLHEAKPLKLRRAAIDNLLIFRSESG